MFVLNSLDNDNTKDSKAKQEDVDKLAREANKQWWEENKHRFYRSEIRR